MIGQTILHYTILAKLGEGGMGVVYKAKDNKLDRVVALKFLPHHIVPGEEEQMRFLQEARAAATLNHPNVCTIYDIREEEGQQFILMEYVDGMTLRQKLLRSTLKPDEVLSYGIQIGEALQEAHGKGIVHRDVKAENIMVNSRNQVKVMDFGLAKLKGSMRLTKATSTVGTLASMAPEQIQGGDVDARSDIFSFGVVVYEMCTGHSPFRGEHDAAMMYSILNEDPAPATNLMPGMAPEIAHVLGNALEKNPDDRYQTAAEMVRELRRLAKQSTRVVRTVPGGMQPTPGMPATGQSGIHQVPGAPPFAATEPISTPQRRQIPLWTKLAGGAVVIALAAFGIWQLTKPSYEISKDMVFKPLSIPFSTIWYPGISADGNWITFPATDDQGVTELYYMNASGGEPKALTHDSLFKYNASISPDGSQIVYSCSTGRNISYADLGLWTVSTLGGTPKKVTEYGVDGVFSPDGKSIGFLGGTATTATVSIVDADGANLRTVVEDVATSTASRESFAWSPDGSSIAFIRNFVSGGSVVQEIFVKDLHSGAEQQVTHDRKNIDEVWWTANNLILFSSTRGGPSNLWAIPATGGTPIQITRGPGPDIAVRASRDGRRVLYLQQAEFGSIQIGDADGRNSREITPADQSVRGPRFSPDGRTIAYIATDPDPIKPGSSIYLMNRDGQNRRRILQMSTMCTVLFWSPDGKKIAYRCEDSVYYAGVVNVESPGQSTDLGRGFVMQWLEGGAALNILKAGFRDNACWRVPLDGSAPSKISDDSTGVMILPGGGSKMVGDRHLETQRLYLQFASGARKTILEGNFYALRFSPDGKGFMLIKSDASTWLISADGKISRYEWRDPSTPFPEDVARDLKASLSVRNRRQSKLILIDGLM